ncbi:MAG: hypothetical protein WAU91_07870 [Desulfatitalea sp.]
MQPTPEHLMKGLERRAQKGFQGYPLGIIAFYGYNDKIASKAVIGIIKEAGGSPEHTKKWVFEKGDLRKDVPSIKELFRYIESHDVRSVALTPGIYYCPHDPGIDFPEGGTCSLCPFWSNVKKPDLFKTAKADPALDRPHRILEILTDAVRNKKTLLYGDVMQAVGLAYQDALHRQLFKKDLRAAVQQSELYAHGLLISALLVFKIQHIPEDDFFLMAQELGMFTAGKDSKISFFKDHIESIYRYYQRE